MRDVRRGNRVMVRVAGVERLGFAANVGLGVVTVRLDGRDGVWTFAAEDVCRSYLPRRGLLDAEMGAYFRHWRENRDILAKSINCRLGLNMVITRLGIAILV